MYSGRQPISKGTLGIGVVKFKKKRAVKKPLCKRREGNAENIVATRSIPSAALYPFVMRVETR